MLKKIMKSKNGEGYVDLCVGVIAFVMILVIAINIFSFITLRVETGRIADELLEAATFSGSFGNEFDARREQLEEQYDPFTVETEASDYFNTAYRRVQLGHVMTVTVSAETVVRGLGVFQIPVTLTVTRSGLSQKYWK